MNHPGRRILIALCFLIGLAGAGSARGAGSSVYLRGVLVKYSLPGMDAYYDADDETLTIDVWQSGGKLSVRVTDEAYYYWGDYIDIYLLADDRHLPSVTIKGSPLCFPYIAGQFGCLDKFSLTEGCVGGTDYYGEMGIGMSACSMLVSVKMKYAMTMGPLGGVDYSLTAAGRSLPSAKRATR